jgi:hypothetical protein
MGEDKRPCPALHSENIMESGGKQMKRKGHREGLIGLQSVPEKP